jgi:hypothetical protein
VIPKVKCFPGFRFQPTFEKIEGPFFRKNIYSSLNDNFKKWLLQILGITRCTLKKIGPILKLKEIDLKSKNCEKLPKIIGLLDCQENLCIDIKIALLQILVY